MNTFTSIFTRELTQSGISWIFAIAFCVGFFVGKVPPEAFCSVASGVVVWWFRGKIDQKGGAK